MIFKEKYQDLEMQFDEYKKKMNKTRDEQNTSNELSSDAEMKSNEQVNV